MNLNQEDNNKISEYIKGNKLHNVQEYKNMVSNLPGPPIDKSITILFPDVASQWNYAKNDPLKPEMFSPGSDVKVWWVCEKGHEWPSTISHRTAGRRCPYCAGKKVTPENNLASLYPEIAKEWHPTKNAMSAFEILPGSNKKYWWVCINGHEYQANSGDRVMGRGCPICWSQNRGKIMQKSALRLSGSLAENNPLLAKEWHPTKNMVMSDEVTPNSGSKAWWMCVKGHEWEAVIASRNAGRGCPICNNISKKERVHLYALNKKGSLAQNNPELTREWHPTRNIVLPNDVTENSHTKVWWRCDNGHEWQASIGDRSRGNGCPLCNNIRKRN